MTYWFDAAPSGEPYPVSVRFTGRRVGGWDGPASETSPPAHRSADSFDVVQTLERVLPGSGRIALTARVSDVAPGKWEVTATPARADGSAPSAVRVTHSPVQSLLTRGTATGWTTFLPAARALAPGVRLAAWPTLVGFGAAVALTLQAVLGAGRQLPTLRLLLVSLAACLVGLAGAKAYYLLTHPAEKGAGLKAGMSVQGFILAALGTVAAGSWLAGIPIGPMLDSSAPGLLFGLAIGRLGCLLGGCCVGRPTASRWGVWSSDRQVGVRRIPVQLMESAMAAAVAVATLLGAALLEPPVNGLLLVTGLAAYITGRQLLFPLRGIPRVTSWGGITTLVAAALVAATGLVALMVGATAG